MASLAPFPFSTLPPCWPLQAGCLRLTVEPEAAAGIQQALEAAPKLQGWALGCPLEQVVGRLVLASE